MKFPSLSFHIVNRWTESVGGRELFVIWLGTFWRRGDAWMRIHNVWTLDITIANIGFQFTIAGNPPVSEKFFKRGSVTPIKCGMQ